MSRELSPQPSRSQSSICRAVPIDAVTVGHRQRDLTPAHVSRLHASYEQLGSGAQLQPIIVDPRFRLIDGAHRLAAAKQAGWREINALILSDLDEQQLPLLEIEANLVRKNLTPVELEAAWSEHYEPSLRAQARTRQLSALRRGTTHARLEDRAAMQRPALSLALAAKQTTGLSLDTLKKISVIRKLSTASGEPSALGQAAARAMRRLERPGASVSALYREVMSVRERAENAAASSETSVVAKQQQVLEHTLHEVSRLACKLEAELAAEFASAARAGHEHREHLRALRVSLARILAITVAIECGLESSPVNAMKQTSAEVARLLSRVSLDQLRKQGNLA